MDYTYTRSRFPDEEVKRLEDEDRKDQENNTYLYHENLQSYDPHGQPYSYFYVTVSGCIEFGEFLSLDGLAIKYEFVAGDDWALSHGN